MTPSDCIGSESGFRQAVVDLVVDAIEAEPWPAEGGWHAFAAQVATKIADGVLAASGQEKPHA